MSDGSGGGLEAVFLPPDLVTRLADDASHADDWPVIVLAARATQLRRYGVVSGEWDRIGTRLLTRQEAAETLRVSVRTIDRLISTGEIEAARVGSRRLPTKASIDNLIEKRFGPS